MMNRFSTQRASNDWIFYLAGACLLVPAYLMSASAYLASDLQLVLSWFLLFLIFISEKAEIRIGRVSRIFIMTVCAFLSFRYWIFRTTRTLSFDGGPDTVFSLLLYLAETYGLSIYFMGMLVNAWPIHRESPALPESEHLLPTVDVYIPTYSEPVEMIRITAVAATQILYPPDRLNIYILDDGGTRQKLDDPDPAKASAARIRARELKALASELGILYATRDLNVRAKAGNINEALDACECRLDEDAFDKIACINEGIQQGCGELILILDCDHVPARDFLQKTVGFFIQDPKLFLVQTPHFFINPDPVEKNLQTFRKSPSENEMFYGAIHPGLDFWNASFFCGSAAVLRRKYLLEAGGLSGNTITEDCETALGLHARGYNSVYLGKPLIIGLSPETFDGFIVQRSRWAQGMIQIFILKQPFFQKGLTLFQKICYFNSSFFWFFGLARVIFFISPLLLLFFGLRIYNASLTQVVCFAVPHLIGAYFLSNYLFGRFRHPFFSELYETIQSIYLLPAIVSAMIHPRSPVFKVTPKAVSLETDFLSHLAAPFYVMLLLSIAAYGAGVYRWMTVPGVADAVLVCLVWNSFNVLMVLSCLGVVWERRQIRKMHRYATRETVGLEVSGSGTLVPAELFDLSVGGAGIRIPVGSKGAAAPLLNLHAVDSYGNAYVLPMKVTHRRHLGDHLVLGCAFLTSKPGALTDVVNFVYGDSSRWQFYGQAHSQKRINTLAGLFRLLKTGVKGSFTHFGGIMSILWINAIGFFSSPKQLHSREEK